MIFTLVQQMAHQIQRNFFYPVIFLLEKGYLTVQYRSLLNWHNLRLRCGCVAVPVNWLIDIISSCWKLNIVHRYSASSPGFKLCATFLNIAQYLKTVRWGCAAVAVIFSIYLKPVLYDVLFLSKCMDIFVKSDICTTLDSSWSVPTPCKTIYFRLSLNIFYMHKVDTSVNIKVHMSKSNNRRHIYSHVIFLIKY